MPTISMFYGIIVYMYFFDTDKHNLPHIHIEYQGNRAVIAIENGKLLAGKVPAKKLKLVQAWLIIHQEAIMADWSLAVQGAPIFPVPPLQ